MSGYHIILQNTPGSADLYQSQVDQLVAMGFPNREANLRGKALCILLYNDDS